MRAAKLALLQHELCARVLNDGGETPQLAREALLLLYSLVESSGELERLLVASASRNEMAIDADAAAAAAAAEVVAAEAEARAAAAAAAASDAAERVVGRGHSGRSPDGSPAQARREDQKSYYR